MWYGRIINALGAEDVSQYVIIFYILFTVYMYVRYYCIFYFIIGTSNWSGDYFVNTGGVSCVVNQTNTTVNGSKTIQGQLEMIFERDWNSEHAKNMSDYDMSM